MINSFDAQYLQLTEDVFRPLRVDEAVEEDVQLLRTIPFQSHQLSEYEMRDICRVAEEALATGHERSDSIYLSTRDTLLSRDLMINFSDKTFTILAKKNGQLKARGGMKKASDSIEINTLLSFMRAIDIPVRLVNQHGKTLSNTELTYEQKYGSLRTFAAHLSKKGFPKVSFTKDRLKHDVSYFTKLSNSCIALCV